MIKEEFLKRCEVQWESMEKLDESVFDMLHLATEYVNRKQWWQEKIATELWERIDELSKGKTLYNNRSLYKAFNFASRLAHPCQKCAEDKDDWATRWWFCNHKKYKIWENQN